MLIDADKWVELAREGWRLAINLTGDAEQDVLTIADWQNRCFVEKVPMIIGPVFDYAVHLPARTSEGLAIYAKDVANLIRGLREDILNLECGHPLVLRTAKTAS